MNLTDEQLRVLRHMLGIDKPYEREPKPYRDYYCANPGDEKLYEMERVGAVRMYAAHSGYEWFTCTDAGRAAALASHKTIRKSKGARLYRRFLELTDCWPEFTFKQFLTDPRLLDTRRQA